MKLYILDGGFINHPDKSSFIQGLGEKVPFTFKVSMYLIEHPKGLAVVDLGIVRDKFPEFMKGDTIDEPEKGIDCQIIPAARNIFRMLLILCEEKK